MASKQNTAKSKAVAVAPAPQQAISDATAAAAAGTPETQVSLTSPAASEISGDTEASAIVSPVAMAEASHAVVTSDAARAPESLLRIRAKTEGFRRAGMSFSREPQVFSAGALTEAQLEVLRAEPMLIVEDL